MQIPPYEFQPLSTLSGCVSIPLEDAEDTQDTQVVKLSIDPDKLARTEFDRALDACAKDNREALIELARFDMAAQSFGERNREALTELSKQ